ncbi:MAG TPA: class I SAM-dependent methyltransferase [Desulfobacteraceae bacterium]|nr:class I SAM-dependent methyltransferase [Desulfobacteraceae bacterium]
MPDMTSVEDHYACPDLAQKIRAAFELSGKTIRDISIRDLGPVDQLHTGGAPATLALMKKANLPENSRVLDAGCGIGGSSRLLADTFGFTVTGIDLVTDFVETARTLSEWAVPHLDTGSDISFDQGSVTDLPYEDNTFDAVLCQHILMNIPDKAAGLKEFSRVLRSGGKLILHEITDGDGPAPQMPVPWASNASTSFLVSREQLAEYLSSTGFTQVFFEDITEASARWWQKVNEITAKAPARPLNPRLVFGDNAARFGPNMEKNFSNRAVCCICAILTKNTV